MITTKTVIAAEELAAAAGFGKKRILEIAKEVGKREVKSLYDLTDPEVETLMLTLRLLATPTKQVAREGEYWHRVTELRKGMTAA